MTLYTTTFISPVGTLELVAGTQGLRAILWENDTPDRVKLESREAAPDHEILRLTRRQLGEYFAGARTTFSVALDPIGTDFQRAVWSALRTIPFGETRSYAAIARQIGRPGAARAVGAANRCNPISIIAPCHRVVGADGSLTGFAGGLSAKRFLLEHEERHPARAA